MPAQEDFLDPGQGEKHRPVPRADSQPPVLSLARRRRIEAQLLLSDRKCKILTDLDFVELSFGLPSLVVVTAAILGRDRLRIAGYHKELIFVVCVTYLCLKVCLTWIRKSINCHMKIRDSLDVNIDDLSHKTGNKN